LHHSTVLYSSNALSALSVLSITHTGLPHRAEKLVINLTNFETIVQKFQTNSLYTSCIKTELLT